MGNNDELYPVAMTVAGSDSGGGAGIQADLRTFSAFGVFGCSAITAITAQNPFEVRRIDALPGESVKTQIEAVRDKFSVGAVKTGMLCNAEIIRAAAPAMASLKCPLVVDPVMVATSGAKLLEDDAVVLMMSEILPLASWITPNSYEAELLAEMPVKNLEDMIAAGKKCAEKWQCSCIVKGGHIGGSGGEMIDVVIHNGKVLGLSSPEIEESKAAHGTGCTFSAALTAALALGIPWKKALKAAKDFVFGSLAEAVPVGRGTYAMYPPQSSYVEEIKLTRID